MSREKLGTIISIISGASFATLAIFSKLAYTGGANVPTVLFWRFAGAALVFFSYLVLQRKLISYNRQTVIRLLLMGSLGYGSMSACFLLAVERIPASLASMLLYLYPAFVTILTAVLKQDTLTWRKAGALLVASTGLVLVLGASLAQVDLAGLALGVGAAAVYTVYIVSGSKLMSRLEPINSTMYIMIGAGLAYAVLGLATQSIVVSMPATVWLVIAGIVLIPTVAAVLFFWLGVRYIGPAKTSIISSIEPLVTVILAWLAFGERLSPPQLGGGLLIIFSIIILQYPFKELNHKVEAD